MTEEIIKETIILEEIIKEIMTLFVIIVIKQVILDQIVQKEEIIMIIIEGIIMEIIIDEDSDSEMSDIQDNTRMSMPENTSNNTQNQVGKMTRIEALQKAYQVRERKFKCRNCDNIGHFTTNCPTLPIKEKEKIMKVRERNKERKQKSFPINLEKSIKDIPCGLI